MQDIESKLAATQRKLQPLLRGRSILFPAGRPDLLYIACCLPPLLRKQRGYKLMSNCRCMLLTESGKCSVHDARPAACRHTPGKFL